MYGAPSIFDVTQKSNSEQIGIATLLNRLKQSIASAKVGLCMWLQLKSTSD